MAIAVILFALVTGCSDSDDGDHSEGPVPNLASSAPASTDLESPVANPRDIRGFAGRPCDVLTPAQLGGFGIVDPVGVPGSGISPGTETCAWGGGGADVPAGFDVTFDPSRDIFNQRLRSAAADPIFERVTIDGLAAVRHQALAGGGQCTVAVGIADQQGLSVGFSDKREPFEDPCGNAERVAAAIVSNLPPLQ